MRHCHTVGEFICYVLEKELGNICSFSSGMVNGVIEIIRTWVPELNSIEPDTLLPDLGEYPSNCEDISCPAVSMTQRKLLYDSLYVWFNNAESDPSGNQMQAQTIFCACMQIVAMVDHIEMLREAPLIKYNSGIDQSLDNTLQSKDELVRKLQDRRRKILDIEQQLANSTRDVMMTVNWEKEKNKKEIGKMMDVNKALTAQLRARQEKQQEAENLARTTVRQARENELLLERRKQEIAKLKKEACNFYSVQVSCLQREKNFKERLDTLKTKEQLVFQKESKSIDEIGEIIDIQRRGSKCRSGSKGWTDPSTGHNLEQKIRELEAAALHHSGNRPSFTDSVPMSEVLQSDLGPGSRGTGILSKAVQTDQVAIAKEVERPSDDAAKQNQARAFPRIELGASKKKCTTTQRRMVVEDLKRDVAQVEIDYSNPATSPGAKLKGRGFTSPNSRKTAPGPILAQETQDGLRSMGLRNSVLQSSLARTTGAGGGGAFSKSAFNDSQTETSSQSSEKSPMSSMNKGQPRKFVKAATYDPKAWINEDQSHFTAEVFGTEASQDE